MTQILQLRYILHSKLVFAIPAAPFVTTSPQTVFKHPNFAMLISITTPELVISISQMYSLHVKFDERLKEV